MTNTETAADLNLSNPWIVWGTLADFVAVPRVTIHVKPEHLHMYDAGSKKIAVELVAVKARGEAYLLVALPTAMTIGCHVNVSHVAIRATECAEGHRFNRTIVRAVKVLAALGREMTRKRSTAAKLAERAASRAGRVGTCQICEGEHVVRSGLVVLHGYNRPGFGYVVGSCYGVSEKPFEVSCDALVRWIAELGRIRAGRATSLVNLATATEATVERYTGKGRTGYELVTITPADTQFERTIAQMRSKLESEIMYIGQDIARHTARVTSWKAAK